MNAGVPLANATLEGDRGRVFLGVTLGLLLGKPLGILAVSWAAVKLGAARLPSGVAWPHVGLVGSVAGIGFTMALFIAQLAFPVGPLLETAKLAVLVGSGASAVLGLMLGHLVLRAPVPVQAAQNESLAESSTER